ncbi:Xaa-Pro dipeptidase [Melampsora larici-populina 98AG31]|uniref:Xaa-Pro dipeptidase n=1 Tax=Melampsora larici-populina (strain 98AG31 / pathotype 3-4-7) TaxID=747676 RepID=F4RY54_MELLP|nr:Xaa-Pro dipeptidase [Melampsora larici-populina 98AG31]EGG02699.1 Xaa-Pro dipeptidase [Melampsora larici-populina 98AG31]
MILFDDSPPSPSSNHLNELRKLMRNENLQFYVVPSTDSHRSEYLAPCDERRAFISNFTGSAGTAIIGLDDAWLFTDSRYWQQAEDDLDLNCWNLMKVGTSGVFDWIRWLGSDDVPRMSRIGIDSMLVSHTEVQTLEESLHDRESSLVCSSENLIDQVWGSKRPILSQNPIYLHPLEYCGQTSQDKLEKLKSYIREYKAGGYLINSLSELCWILNIRGSDVPYNPFPFAYLFVSTSISKPTILFLHNPKHQHQEVQQYLKELEVQLEDYDKICEFMGSLEIQNHIIIDSTLPIGLYDTIDIKQISETPSIITQWKSIKNLTELNGFRNAYLRDALAWCRWSAWLEHRILSGDEINEWDAAIKFDEIRSRHPMFISLSYANISATNENAALPHYEPTIKQNRIIDLHTFYLNDSGAHYLDGTTDTTRTVFFGKSPTPEQKLAYTIVLQGHLAVARAIFPALTLTQTTGSQLDVLAREPGWFVHGKLYGHGTGHGVGSCSSVHEGPHAGGLRFYLRALFSSPLKIGHTFTIEPGHYDFEKKIGIRIESFFGVKECDDLNDVKMKGTKWLELERFTQVPIAKNCIDWDLMNQVEKDWIDSHNEECKDKLKGLFDLENHEDRMAFDWLMKQ